MMLFQKVFFSSADGIKTKLVNAVEKAKVGMIESKLN